MFVGATYLGGWMFMVFLLVLALLAQYEVYQMMRVGGVKAHRTTGLIAGALVFVGVMLPWVFGILLLLLIGYIGASAFSDVERQSLFSVAGTILGVVYPTILLSSLAHLRLDAGMLLPNQDAFLLTLYILVLVWAADTCAFYSGRSLGRTPLAPRISPKKTWEGAAGGALGVLLVGLLLKVLLLPFVAWAHVVALALICGVAGPIGDLAESRFKRTVGVKDSGRILPGHGGMLDRLDGLTLASPLAYLYLLWATPLL